MIKEAFLPAVYLRENCPFCLKVRLFCSRPTCWGNRNPGVRSRIEDEEEIRLNWRRTIDMVSFPTAKIEPDRYLTGPTTSSVYRGAVRSRATQDAVFTSYVEAALKPMLRLSKENSS